MLCTGLRSTEYQRCNNPDMPPLVYHRSQLVYQQNLCANYEILASAAAASGGKSQRVHLRARAKQLIRLLSRSADPLFRLLRLNGVIPLWNSFVYFDVALRIAPIQAAIMPRDTP